MVRPTLAEDVEGARRVMQELEDVGIDFKDVTDTLLREGVASFAKSFDDLMTTIRTKREKFLAQGK
jgi:transaldolase/glucose-6-phosphate isomerase